MGLQKMLLGMSTRILYKATNINGYLAILIGTLITILVQSSSITTSTLTPQVGIGVLRLEEMLPLTLGANIGTTVTAFLASMVSGTVNALQVSLAHLMFNIIGIIIFYPIPFMRRIPLGGARALGKATRLWRGFPIVYILTLFVVIPIALFGISSLFEQDTIGFTVLGGMLVAFIVLGLVYLIYQWRFGGLAGRCTDCFERRQAKMNAMTTLADDMDYLKVKVDNLAEHTGLPDGYGLEGGEAETKKLLKDDKHEKVFTMETAPAPLSTPTYEKAAPSYEQEEVSA